MGAAFVVHDSAGGEELPEDPAGLLLRGAQIGRHGGAGRLTQAGLVARSVDEGPPVSVAYTLTDAGRALLPALRQISRWAEPHLPA